MTVTEIINELTPFTGKFPKAAMQAAIEQQEAITPHLLQGVTEVAKAPAEFNARKPAHMLHLFALFLLAQFREKEAYPLVVQLLRAPGDLTYELLGDTVTEKLKNILASVYNGDPSLLESLIEDDQVEEFVRGAAVESFIVLAHTGQMTREAVLAYYQSLFRGRLTREYNQVWNALACAVADLPANDPCLCGSGRKYKKCCLKE